MLGPASSKENINDASKVDGTLVKGIALGSVDKDVAITFILAATGEVIVVAAEHDKLSG